MSNDNMHLISKGHLNDIKRECLYWSNNCGGCETCLRMFPDTPPYNHQETYFLVLMIEARDKEIKRLKDLYEPG